MIKTIIGRLLLQVFFTFIYMALPLTLAAGAKATAKTNEIFMGEVVIDIVLVVGYLTGTILILTGTRFLPFISLVETDKIDISKEDKDD